MAKLAVKDDWFAPVDANRYERRWYEIAGARVAGLAPEVIAADDAPMLFAMEYLDPADTLLWKTELHGGARRLRTSPRRSGASLAAIHAATAETPRSRAMFPTGAIFEALRLEPYLRPPARRHPALAGRLDALADRTAATRRRARPWRRQPEEHPGRPGRTGPPRRRMRLVRRSRLRPRLLPQSSSAQMPVEPARRAGFLAGFDALAASLSRGRGLGAACRLEARAAGLLPGLFLARVDGKSPVEYVTEERDKDRVRRVARPFSSAAATLETIRDAWAEELGR